MLADEVVSTFAEPARRYRHLLENRRAIDKTLSRGAERARERARTTMRAVRNRIGV